MLKNKQVAIGLGLLALGTSASACDLCAIYTAELAEGASGTGMYAGISEQYTNFKDVFEDGHKIDNPAGQALDSWFTQLAVGYRHGPWAVQGTLPYIHRKFTRQEGEVLDQGSVNGIGDTSLVASYDLVRKSSEDGFIAWQVLGGIKFATGASGRIAEELEEGHHDGVTANLAKHGEPASAIHGHDLALGSGSTDFIFGSNLRWRQQRWLGDVGFQYGIRRRGDFDYRYANEVHWNVSTGRYLKLEHDKSVAVVLNLSGEQKGEDRLAGVRASDTSSRSILLGPALRANFGASNAFELGWSWRINEGNSGIQMLPDNRLRAGFTHRF